MPRYTICPYYINENKNNISCEDVRRYYDSLDEKWAWMDMYCDSWDWMKCPYAADMNEAYRKAEEGDEMAVENQEIEALRKENHALQTKLGRANKKVERLQKKVDRQQKYCDNLRAVNQSFTAVNNDQERVNKELHRKWRDAEERIRKQDDRIWGEIGGLTGIYEQRMCYLIDRFAPGGIVYDEDVKAWAEDKAFALVHEYDDMERLAWKVVFGEAEEETDSDGDEVLQTHRE